MAQMIAAELDEQGRMVFPADVVEPLGLTPGATLVVEEVDEGRIRLRVTTHAAHDRAVVWLQKVRDGSATGLIAAHSIAELYAVLTTFCGEPWRPSVRSLAASFR